ncbi:MAG: precorrin-3B C(17)-methyltransferase [Clostridiales bacterium]|jgi:precorrin-3B C17-methyltransferase|nr:precorrin-3B C(17)-methyltransferase [Clostridiales bacterium]
MSLYVVGIGPGDRPYMTGQSLAALEKSGVVVGYEPYIRLIEDLVAGKRIIASGMRKEKERAAAAVEEARNGHTVALVSSGDAGVYGMAGLALEIAENDPDLEIEIIPGVTAALSASAMLGAPLMNDFAAISLSDLLTPWPTIEKRLMAAAQGDFAIALYNPASHKRRDVLPKAREILLQYRAPETPCGLVRNAGREGCAKEICTLAELTEKPVDMFTTVIVGNSQTKVINGRLVTARGYDDGK